MGESCDWSHRNDRKQQCEPVCAARDHAHAGNGLAQLGNDVNAGWAGRANNCNFIMGSKSNSNAVTF
jgi:hypothetical protein